MIVWSGRGILSFLVLILTMILCVFTMPQSYAGYSFITSFLVAGIFSCVFGIKWNYNNLKTYTHKETGKEVKPLINHSIFWIEIQYWGIVSILLGIVMIVQNLNTEGIELYLNIILCVLGIVCLVNFSTTIYKKNIETKANKYVQTRPTVAKVETERMSKFDKEDDSRFLPK